jgi:hypothetical protein
MLEQSPMVLYIMQNYPTVYMADDHDFGWNNAVDDWEVMNTNMTQQGRGYQYTNQADWELARDTAISTLKSYTMGNPAGNWPSADADAAYFSVEIGNCEVFVPAQLCSTYDTGASATMRGDSDGINSLLLGNQMASFKLALQASTKTFKLIASSKANLYNQKVNNDSWGLGYSDWDGDYGNTPGTRTSLGPWIHDNTDTTFTVAGGVATVASDWHSPGVFRTESGLTTQSYDHVSLIAGPTGRDEDVRNSNPLDAGQPNRDSVIFSLQDTASNDAQIPDPERRFYNCCGFIETNDTQMAMQLVTTQFSSIAGAAVSADSNKYTEVIYDMAIYGNKLLTGSNSTISNTKVRSIDVSAANTELIAVDANWHFTKLKTMGQRANTPSSDFTMAVFEATNEGGRWRIDDLTNPVPGSVGVGNAPTAVLGELEVDVNFTTSQQQQDDGKALVIVIGGSADGAANNNGLQVLRDGTTGYISEQMDPQTLTTSTSWSSTDVFHNYSGWGEYEVITEAPTLTTAYADLINMDGDVVAGVDLNTNITGNSSLVVTWYPAIPNGLSESGGVVSGTVTTPTGTTTCTVTGTNSFGSVSDSFQWTTLTIGAASNINSTINSTLT